MQFLTAKTLIYARITILTAVSYFFVKDPTFITSSGFVMLLGQAMQVQFAKVDPTNPLLGFVGVILFTFALCDLIPILAENLDYFDSLVPTRLAFYFALCAYTYFAKQSIVSNSLVFTYSFLEIWLNFLIYNNLRDEKYYRMKKFIEEHSDEIRAAQDEQVTIIKTDD
jgi:membrane-bound acyltransferase YfiQ involved in biofilm formation